MKISHISAHKILASMGSETIAATILFENGSICEASVPAGISAGKYEIHKVSADQAISQINQLNTILSGTEWTQESLDAKLSSNNLGGNATLAVSVAFWKSSISSLGENNKFPGLMVLLFEGGRHGSPTNPNLTIQEFMVLENSLDEARSDFSQLRSRLSQKNIETLVGAEGGFSPKSFDNIKALETIKEVLPGKQMCLDAADCFQSGSCPDYDSIINNFPVFSVEDPYSDEDWPLWTKILDKHGKNTLIVGDDLTATNPDRIKKAIDLHACNAVIIKPNQIGTISKAIEAVNVARNGGLKIIVSHRGEETDDDWIVDFALHVKSEFVKFGGFNRGERIAKYNRMMSLGMK